MGKKETTRITVDPKFKRVLAIESMALNFPSLKSYTKYLGEKATKDNKKLKELLRVNGNNETFN